MQDQADFEASQEIIREIEDAELAKKLDEQEAGLGSDHSDPLGDRDVAPAEENTPPPGPGWARGGFLTEISGFTKQN